MREIMNVLNKVCNDLSEESLVKVLAYASWILETQTSSEEKKAG